MEFPELIWDAEPPKDNDKPPRKAPITVVAESFPKIAVRIELEWGYASLHTYLESLIIDTRGDRSGFPPEVLTALLSLYLAHANEFGFKPTPDKWW